MKHNLRIVSYVILSLISSGVYAQSQSTAPPAGAHSSTLVAPTSRASQKAGKAANRQFSKKVLQALNREKGLTGSDISVFGNAATGEVTLAGFIRERHQDDLAKMVAEKVPGVTSVTSKLVMRENVH
ncbi:BON domain-containing protein [Paraburkholderia bannensis]|uniref:BON domain-containing protein n=1 Tax=Paraburkholderia bannensis TaxID=765414 RepID=UPI002AB5FA6A|nr:BON domain-containing protein [Paraburkholderia bannensis]